MAADFAQDNLIQKGVCRPATSTTRRSSINTSTISVAVVMSAARRAARPPELLAQGFQFGTRIFTKQDAGEHHVGCMASQVLKDTACHSPRDVPPGHGVPGS